MTFIDEAEVEFASGRGGSGAVSFRREKFVPEGGPNGSDGGRGGNVVVIADRNRRTLFDFKLQTKFEAESGNHAVQNKRGKKGKSIEIRLPVGTIISNAETGEVIIDLKRDGMKHILCKGGRGGKGNETFANSVRQAPNFAEKGEPAQRIKAKLELKLLADVGLVGLPNAGKSTLVSAISASKPKIADYPFTTIVPNIGTVRVDGDTFVVADLPGLVEGASDGIGLGHRFLKHVERSFILVHVVDSLPIDGTDPLTNFNVIEEELRSYSDEIGNRPKLIALNKIDLLPPGDFYEVRRQFEGLGFPLFPISAATGEGVENLKRAMLEAVQEYRKLSADDEIEIDAEAVVDLSAWAVEQEEDYWIVTGDRIERMVAMTDLDNDEALRFLQRRLERIGVIDRLRDLGAKDGDDVVIGEFEFNFEDKK